MKHVDSPRPIQHLKTGEPRVADIDRANHILAKLQEFSQNSKEDRDASLRKVRNPPRFSYDGRETRETFKATAKLKELPRLSLDSRESTLRSSSSESRLNFLLRELKTQTSRFSSDYSSCNHEGSKASDWQRSQANQLAPIKSSSSPKRFNSSVLITKSARLMNNSRISSASMVPSADASHLQQLRTHNIPYTREDLLDKPVTKDQTPHKYGSPNPNKCKPPIDKITNVNTSKAVHTTRGPQLGKVDKYTAFGRSSGSVSPRFQQKNHEIEQESCLTIPSTDFGKVRRKLSRQSTEQDSSKRKPRQKSTLRQTKDKLCSATYSGNFIHQSDTASIQSESNSSLASLTETEVTSTESSIEIKTKQQVDQNERNGSARLDEDLPLAQLAIVPTEQPSPISVLDATFYREDSPSPVKKISTIFQDYETSSPDEAEWHYLEDEFNQKKLENINHLVTKLRLLNTMPDEDSMHQVAFICKSPSPDHKYITKVLLASGLLKDKGPISTAIQLQSPGHLINPDLFHVLEQTEQSTKLASEEQKQRTVPLKRDQKIHRKIVFDTVNEILVRKLAAEGPFMPRKRTKTGKELLRELYSEVDRLQANTDCSLDDADGSISILNADMMQQPDDWVDYQSELPAVVLDIERLIFKDLITEVITADDVGLCDWPRRQCMKVLNKQ